VITALFVLRRILSALLLLALVLSATFFLIHLAPGDPTTLLAVDPRVPPEHRQRLLELYGLDQPLGVQYLRWLEAVALHGDWGRSYSLGRPVTEILAESLPNTVWLVCGTLLVQYGFGLLLGIAAATRRDGLLDHQIRAVSLLLFALPSFWLALMAIEGLSVRLDLFPASGMRSLDADVLPAVVRLADRLHHLALPALVLGLSGCGQIARLVRNGLIEVLSQDYVRAARARGLSPGRVLWVHALPNALGPVVQGFGVVLPSLLSGALIIEAIFAWPGVGRVAYRAILSRDYPMVLATTALAAALVVLGSLLADLLHAWLDPRVRESHA